jgi:hypothetical protein
MGLLAMELLISGIIGCVIIAVVSKVVLRAIDDEMKTDERIDS